MQGTLLVPGLGSRRACGVLDVCTAVPGQQPQLSEEPHELLYMLLVCCRMPAAVRLVHLFPEGAAALPVWCKQRQRASLSCRMAAYLTASGCSASHLHTCVPCSAVPVNAWLTALIMHRMHMHGTSVYYAM